MFRTNFLNKIIICIKVHESVDNGVDDDTKSCTIVDVVTARHPHHPNHYAMMIPLQEQNMVNCNILLVVTIKQAQKKLRSKCFVVITCYILLVIILW